MRYRNGGIAAVAFYRVTEEIQMEFLGTPDADGSGSGTTALAVGAALNTVFHSATEQSGNSNIEVVIDEITTDKANEDFLKTSVRATVYGITATGQ